MNARNRFSDHPAMRRIGMIVQGLMMMGFIISFSIPTALSQCLQVEKSLLGVTSASSGVPGNMDVTYQILVINTACPIATDIEIFDDLDLPSNLGTGFIRIVGAPVVALSPALGTAPTLNPNFDGGLTDAYITTASGSLIMGDSLILQFTAEVDVDAPMAPADLSNQATVYYTDDLEGEFQISTNLVALPNCWSNCQLACNNQVQVSVNSVCEAEILASMILEGEIAACADLGFFEVTIYYNNKKVNLPLDQTYLNKKLRVNVRNIVCNNSCWGNLILEDKSPPVMTCRNRDTISCAANTSPQALGFPVDVNFVDQSVYPYVVRELDACGVVYLTYEDQIVKYDCSNDSLSATIYRKWCAKDPGGYEACCYDTIDLRRGTLADVVLPPHYDGQPGNQPYLSCDGLWTKLPNGLPDTTNSGTGKPSGIYCGNIQYDFSDDTIQVCKGTYKLLRRWVILDWCNPTMRIDWIQQIKVVDDRAPIVICPSNYTVSTNPWTCSGSLILPVPQDLTPQTIVDGRTPYVIENCSGWTYTVRHLPAVDPSDCTPIPGQGDTRNITRLPDGRFRVDNMPLGCNWIYYIITDGCGNSTLCQFDIVVEDKTPPVAVCHQKTVISIGSNGKAVVPASVFDDHSHDNCGDVRFEVRRMDAGPCGSDTFNTEQVFCCDDVSATNPVRVVLRVIDQAGNSSECMVEAYVQDKLAPRLTCPANVTVKCGTDLTNLDKYGFPTATDNCSVKIETRVYNNLNSCGVGQVIREFSASDKGGLVTVCSQIITVVDSTPFQGTDIVWPRDTLISGCTQSPTPDVSGKPIYKNRDACNLPVATFEDLAFNYVEGVCYKILRKWTVIDWCSYNPTNGAGIWYHTQVIKINNTDLPVFTSSCANQQYCITRDCSANLTLEATATDLCTPQDELRWTYSLDLKNDGLELINGNNNRVNYDLPEGVHRISWTVEDQCGNRTSCSYLITMVDCKRPTPYCLNGIVTVLMPSTGSVTIWASDFNLNSEDNCTPKGELKYSFSSTIADISRIFTCADIPNGISDTIEVSMYVTDKAGNQDYCRTKLILQDNQNVCPDVPTFGNLGGAIRGYNQNPSPDVAVSIESAGVLKNALQTDHSGSYVFGDLDMKDQYAIRPQYNKDPLVGVSTKDIVKIQRHILGLEFLDSPYKLIAADVNLSGSITARDISELRKMILGVQDEFEAKESWTFVDALYPLSFDNYLTAPSVIEISSFQQSMMNNDFVAIKTGDVTGEANTGLQTASVSRTGEVLLMEVDALTVNGGETIKVPIRNAGNTMAIQGLQFALQLDPEHFELLGLESATLDIQSPQYVIRENGLVKLSWNADQDVTIEHGAILAYLVCKAKQVSRIDLLNFKLAQEALHPEVYTDAMDLGISLVYRSEVSGTEGGYELFQNIPNPFVSESTIYFNAPGEREVRIGFYDLSGKMMASYDLKASKGLNALKIKTEDLNFNGVLYYRLEADNYSSTKKMIILK